MTETYLISAIAAMATGMVAMFWYIASLHKFHTKKQETVAEKMQSLTEKYAEQTKELALSVVESSTRTAIALETNNKLFDKLTSKK